MWSRKRSPVEIPSPQFLPSQLLLSPFLPSLLLDFGGRIDFEWDAEFRRERVGDVPTEMFRHFFHSLCCAARCNLQIAAKGDNDHHKAEAIFKAFARALRMAVARSGFGYDIPSSKGVL